MSVRKLMNKIRKILIEGFRGANAPLELKFGKRNSSMAIYGDNGGGKSTITDAIEWYFADRIKYLWKEDCQKDCLRNTKFPKDRDSIVSLEFSNAGLSSEKTLTPALRGRFSNSDDTFKKYIKQSNKERLFLRYNDILRFILKTKGEKRSELLEIIGFGQLDETRAILVKSCNELEKDSRFKEVRNRIDEIDSYFLEEFGEVISDDMTLFQKVDELLRPLKLENKVIDKSSYEKAIDELKTKTDIEKLEKISKLSDLKKELNKLTKKLEKPEEITDFLKDYEELIKNKDKIKKKDLILLLEKGRKLIEEKFVGVNICPLCLNRIDSCLVIEQLVERINELEDLNKELQEVKSEKTEALQNISAIKQAVIKSEEKILKDDEDFESLSEKLTSLKQTLDKNHSNIETGFSKFIDLQIDSESLEESFNPIKLEVTEITPIIDKKISDLSGDEEQKKRYDIHEKITYMKKTYDDNEKMKKELEIFERQYKTLSEIKERFVKKQAKVLEAVLNAISGDIDVFYRIINPQEGVKNIRLELIGEDGIEFKYVFHGKESHPPLKYLSESHLNCLGICLFLSSVKLFNKENKFLILDDVITSFDKDHRMPFLRLLQEHFADYQILLFTHERFWYELINKEMKEFSWSFNDVSWSIGDGIQLETSVVGIKERIQQKIDRGELELGNDLRKLLEHILKDICYNLKAKVEFCYNDSNEKRMSGELLSALRSRLNKQKCDIRDSSAIKRIETTKWLTSYTSHDSPPLESKGDILQVRKDIEVFENLFLCPECNKYTSLEYADSAGKKVKCRCGNKEISWAFA